MFVSLRLVFFITKIVKKSERANNVKNPAVNCFLINQWSGLDTMNGIKALRDFSDPLHKMRYLWGLTGVLGEISPPKKGGV